MNAKRIVCLLLLSAVLSALISCAAPRRSDAPATDAPATDAGQPSLETSLETRESGSEIPATKSAQTSENAISPDENTSPRLQCREEGDGGILAVWWWNAATAVSKNTRGKYLGFLCENGINRVYLCVPDKRFDELPAVVTAMKKNGIGVCLLAGDASYIEPEHAGFAGLLTAYLDYQKNAADNEKLAALHLDVEPHQFSDYAEKKDEYMQQYADFVVQTAKTLHENGEKLELDVPFWYDGFKVKEGEREVELLDLLVRSVDTLTLMGSRDREKDILDAAARETELCKTYGKTLICGVEANSPEGENVSFKEEGKAIMYDVIKEVYAHISAEVQLGGYGVAIHHLDSWYKLKDE